MHSKKGKTWCAPRFKLDQNVYITLRAEVAPQRRTEDGQFTDMVAAAEGLEPIKGHVYGAWHDLKYSKKQQGVTKEPAEASPFIISF